MPINILILGAGGLLGNALFRYFFGSENFNVFGTARINSNLKGLPEPLKNRILYLNVDSDENLSACFDKVKPNIVINCIGVIKQREESFDPLVAIKLNSLLPYRLYQQSFEHSARLIHFSTDCVFSGNRGFYSESDVPDACDLYGRSKLMGEVDYPNTLTLRTSLIGHELHSSRSLISWFLEQKVSVQGYTKAIFSGLPTVEIGRVIEQYVLHNLHLRGIYHLSAEPISKHDLLVLVRNIYGNQIDIIPDDSLVIDRSLNSSRFREATGFVPKSWPEMIQAMHDFG